MPHNKGEAMAAYYNEFDKQAAQWLRNLIDAGLIAKGDVDEQSIEDVRPSDLRGYTQCHFFAGIGVWSYALRRAGWSDDRPVWTGSCPCQPFSAAGEGAGFADERHLWPAFFHLISEHKKWCESQKRKPPRIFGEQVASKDADPWIDLVQDDLEALGYAVGAVPFPAASVGAPHIRDRLYWVADAHDEGLEGRRVPGKRAAERLARASGLARRLANASDFRQHGWRAGEAGDGRDSARVESERLCNVGGLADTDGRDSGAEREQRSREQRQQPQDGGRGAMGTGRREPNEHIVFDMDSRVWTGPTNGYWRDADWLGCTDGKWRPVEPGTFPLVDGATNRVGRLRAYGNAINAEAAIAFILAAA
jgi:DNA (cytosine-5)-methyltransferase 1